MQKLAALWAAISYVKRDLVETLAEGDGVLSRQLSSYKPKGFALVMPLRCQASISCAGIERHQCGGFTIPLAAT